ncbi:ABC transporter ATP-binding protein [[Clostridium] scindens]|uniref:ABC transporter ATP-binding protein n=1 Tax=Clostridium scindens (strain JCM 10418 / VPI 12708) TaxID=29347 RepID=UPI00242DBC04|nr:energy-coupling factor ABC transporter ATP-binding protein [[Clostridium] scindens]
MIELNNICFQYANTEESSLENVSLQIPDGQCVLFCGESGCGKTTITRLLNGLIPHYYEGELKGDVLVKGLNVKQEELYDTARIVGSVFQNPRSQFFCVDTTSEIAFGCENMGLPEQEIRERMRQTVRELNMEQLLERDIFELSGGEKQKVACASVSALHPEVFVLDEPTSNLDVNAIEDLKKTLMFWKSEGKTIVIAEHRLYWLTELCDRVVYMKAGKIVLDISMDEFKNYSEETLSDMGLRTLRMNLHRDVKSAPGNVEKMVLRDFSFSYEKEDAINIPEISLQEGAVIAVIGQNGAGKSTFSRCLCGLEKKFKGKVMIGEKILHRKQLLKQCYMVMQDVNHQLFCESVEEEVQLGMANENCRNVSDVLENLDLERLTERHPMSLSGGQKQRVAIASAILADKPILVFDEPTSGLDYCHMEQTAKLITSLKGKKTIFIVTHDPELIIRCCTHILHLEEGTVYDLYELNQEGKDKIELFFLPACD